MIGHRTAACLALLCALLFCAFAAQGAQAKGTTAFTCKKEKAEVGFKDAHCDEATSVKAEVEYVHSEIAVDVTTEITGSNQKTANKTTEHVPTVFTSTRAGTTIVISCTKLHTEGTLKNTTEGGKMHAGGSEKVHYTECKVTKPVKEGKERCTVKTPKDEVGTITTKTLNWRTKIISEAPEEMGVEVTPAEGTSFFELEFANAPGQTCPFAGMLIPVEGSIIGTPGSTPNGKGATIGFTTEASMQKLTFGGAALAFTGVETVEMKEPTPTTGWAISLTTTAT